MATAEAETSQEEHGAPGGLVYDGFISYSHAADDLLTPRLRAGLPRFAKPWWKRGALRIFRDESPMVSSENTVGRKAENGRLTAKQAEWLDALIAHIADGEGEQKLLGSPVFRDLYRSRRSAVR